MSLGNIALGLAIVAFSALIELTNREMEEERKVFESENEE